MSQPQQSTNLDKELAQAVARGDATHVRDYIEQGASIQQLDSYENTLLHRAAQLDRRDAAQALLDAGVPIDARSTYGNTALHVAVVPGGATVRLLIERGAQIDARNNEGYTPLLKAAACNRIDAFEQLIRAGADISARTHRGDDAFDLAAIQSNDAMALWLLEHYPDLAPTGNRLNYTMAKAVQGNHPKLVAKLADLGADLARKIDGQTLIQLAPRDAHDLKRLLRSLKTGASIRAAMEDSQEPSSSATTHSTPTL